MTGWGRFIPYTSKVEQERYCATAMLFETLAKLHKDFDIESLRVSHEVTAPHVYGIYKGGHKYTEYYINDDILAYAANHGMINKIGRFLSALIRPRRQR